MTDFHQKAFDEGTVTKLGLFERYAEAWLPVFLARSSRTKVVTIVDFFAGPGQDVNGTPGSPLILLKQIRKYTTPINECDMLVRLELNEATKNKAKNLQTLMAAQSVPPELCSWRVHNLDFERAFERLYPTLQDGPNLIFLDQQGMKFMSDELFLCMTEVPKTDFIFFIASSFVRRFAEHPHFKKHLAIPKGTITARSFNDTHRAVTDYYRGLLSPENEYFIGKFSIKKGSNLYGLIFGSPHPLGIEKFLRVCWSIDPERGEANFDIDQDKLDARTPHLFPEMDVARKVNLFQERLNELVLDRKFASDAEVYIHCLKEGMLPKHGKVVITSLKKRGIIRFQGGLQPRVSMAGYKDPRRLEVSPNGDIKH
ncbi:MAG: three-Cys-motif partner protein TcmP [Planctomycetota bacterium]